MRALVIIRLWPLWLIIVLALAAGALLLRRNKRGAVETPPQTPGHSRPSEGDPAAEAALSGTARLATSAVATIHPDMAGIEWPDDVELPEAADTDAKLDQEVWRVLCDILNGQGHRLYAELLGRDGRFRTRDGKRYTLYRTTAPFNRLTQPICVIVRIDMEGHVRARRIIVSMGRPEVRFVDELRDASPSQPRGISLQQATNVDAECMGPMNSSAVLLLAHTLATATRYGDL